MTERRALFAWLLGLALLAGLVVALLTDLPWWQKLGVWVLLTLLLDECGGWFGYLGALAGGAPFLAPLLGARVGAVAAPPEWSVVYPLVLSALVALLLVKHAGAGGLSGLLLSPLAYAAPIVLARSFGHRLDASVTLPEDPVFLAWAVGPAVLGLGLALLRRVVWVAARRDVATQ